MEVPSTGIILIPLELLIIFLPWRFCLMAFVPLSMMPAAAVVNKGGFGLQPGYMFSLLLIARTATEIMASRFTLDRYVLARLKIIFLFVINAFVVLFIAVCFFQHEIVTLPGNLGMQIYLARPWVLGRENFTQSAYLLSNLALLYVLAHQGARRPFAELSRNWRAAVTCGLVFAVSVCLWQFLSFYVDIPFPDDFFYSNAAYSRADNQTMADLLRVNGPFEEPSSAGYQLSGLLIFAYQRYRLFPTAVSVGLITACILCMVCTTSTTAYFGIFVASCIGFYDVISARLVLLTKDFKLSSGQIATIGVIVILALVIAGVLLVKGREIGLIFDETLLHKADTGSFKARAYVDILGLQAFVQSYGIGIGIGSHRPNSLLVTLLSNTGIVGFVLFVAFMVSAFLPEKPALDRGAADAVTAEMRPFVWMLLGLAVMSSFSDPNLSTMALWVQTGGLIGLQAALRRSVTAAARGRDRPRPPATLFAPQRQPL